MQYKYFDNNIKNIKSLKYQKFVIKEQCKNL